LIGDDDVRPVAVDGEEDAYRRRRGGRRGRPGGRCPRDRTRGSQTGVTQAPARQTAPGQSSLDWQPPPPPAPPVSVVVVAGAARDPPAPPAAGVSSASVRTPARIWQPAASMPVTAMMEAQLFIVMVLSFRRRRGR
jgi:hypothetical protein